MSDITVALIVGIIALVSGTITYHLLERKRNQNTYIMGPVRVKATSTQYHRYLRVQRSIEWRVIEDPDAFDIRALKETIMNSDPKDATSFLKFYRAWARYRRRHGTPYNPAIRFTLEELKW